MTGEIDILLLKREKAKLLSRKLELVKQYGLAYYRPHPGQDAFTVPVEWSESVTFAPVIVGGKALRAARRTFHGCWGNDPSTLRVIQLVGVVSPNIR